MAQVELVTMWAPGLLLIASRKEKPSCICRESKYDPSDVQPLIKTLHQLQYPSL